MLIRRTYRLLVTSIAFTISQNAFAIGVGDIVVNSYVNEPLSADIAILDPKDLSDSEVIASLDLEFQEAANSEQVVPEESDTSGMLDSDEDPAETALDLARAYLDMGDKAGAKDLLETAIAMGDEAQVEVAQQLLASIE